MRMQLVGRCMCKSSTTFLFKQKARSSDAVLCQLLPTEHTVLALFNRMQEAVQKVHCARMKGANNSTLQARSKAYCVWPDILTEDVTLNNIWTKQKVSLASKCWEEEVWTATAMNQNDQRHVAASSM